MTLASGMRKGFVLVALVGVAAVIGACGAGPHPEAPVHHQVSTSWANALPSVSEMAQEADAVVIGRVVGIAGSGTDPTSVKPIPYTEFTFAVTQWLKNSGPSSITLKQTGGTDASGDVWTVDGDPLLQVGEQDVLFLQQFAAGEYFIVGGPTGRYNVSNGQVSPMPEGIARDGLPETVQAFIQRVQADAAG